MQIGSSSATFAFYLPNAPLIPQGWQLHQSDAIAALIQLNGNHWRKIFTIMAKISSDMADWRHYREHLLLKQREILFIGATRLAPNAQFHLVCGQVAAQQLGIMQHAQALSLASNFETMNKPQSSPKSQPLLTKPLFNKNMFTDELLPTNQISTQPIRLDPQGKLQDISALLHLKPPQLEKVLLTPYLDYRQYPNALITSTRTFLQSTPICQQK